MNPQNRSKLAGREIGREPRPAAPSNSLFFLPSSRAASCFMIREHYFLLKTETLQPWEIIKLIYLINLFNLIFDDHYTL